MTLWEVFVQERVYLKGVSPATVRYYRWVQRAFAPILDSPTKTGMLECIQALLTSGVSAVVTPEPGGCPVACWGRSITGSVTCGNSPVLAGGIDVSNHIPAITSSSSRRVVDAE